MELRLVTLQDEFPIFNPETRLIKDFNYLITRDKGSKGDNDGRKKKLATKELAFVHFMAYYNSEFLLSYEASERLPALKKHLDMPDGWKPDEAIERAVISYKELTYTPSMDSLVEVRESLFSANKIIKVLRRQLETVLGELDLDIGKLLSNDDEKKNYEIKLDKANSLYDRIIKIADKMPATLETINKLEERVKKEMQQTYKGKGKVEVNEFEI